MLHYKDGVMVVPGGQDQSSCETEGEVEGGKDDDREEGEDDENGGSGEVGSEEEEDEGGGEEEEGESEEGSSEEEEEEGASDIDLKEHFGSDLESEGNSEEDGGGDGDEDCSTATSREKQVQCISLRGYFDRYLALISKQKAGGLVYTAQILVHIRENIGGYFDRFHVPVHAVFFLQILSQRRKEATKELPYTFESNVYIYFRCARVSHCALCSVPTSLQDLLDITEGRCVCVGGGGGGGGGGVCGEGVYIPRRWVWYRSCQPAGVLRSVLLSLRGSIPATTLLSRQITNLYLR